MSTQSSIIQYMETSGKIINNELGENEVFSADVLPQKVSPPTPVTNDVSITPSDRIVPASVDVQPSVISDTAAKRPRPDSGPSSLRLSPASKKVIYDGEEAVYTFEDEPPFWVPMIFKIMDKVHQNVSELKESFDTLQAIQKSFEEYRTVTDQKILNLETAAEEHKSATAQSLLSLQSRESAAAEMISNTEKKAEKIEKDFEEYKSSSEQKIREFEESLTFLNAQVEEQNEINEAFHNEFDRVFLRMDDHEQYSRRNCLVLHGIPETAKESSDDIVIGTIKKNLGVTLDKSAIDRSHRIGLR